MRKRPFIMVAPNGARRGKADHPALPLTIPEIVTCARDCHAAGAGALHLHVRDGQGQHSLDPGLYAEALADLAETVPDLPVQITTEAAGIYDVAAQYDCLTTLRPAWASIAVRETARDPDLAPKLYAACAEQGTRVQHILYDADDIALLADWQARSIVQPGQDAVLFVLGRYATGQVSAPADLAPFRAALPDVTDWMVCAFGPAEHACLLAAANAGGACRVGFENSLTRGDGTPHANNAASVSDLMRQLEKAVQ
ncbi:3-keto-5-aminohexanoate cleavage protein [Thioclava sp.]|uniref:3-keto-5-aminohexanoate cleavage protein n=1 Tax=Thioclava sp. TaxID=1933450 RepID=UPI003AA98C4D